MKLVMPIFKEATLNKYINAERTNRFKAAKIKKECTQQAEIHSRKAIKQGLSIATPCELQFAWYMPNKRQDLDNIAFMKKFVIDGMVKAKLIENDGYKQIRAFSDVYKIDKDNPRVEIEIKGIEDDKKI